MNEGNLRKKDEIFKSKKHLGSGTFGRVEKVLSKIDGKTYAIKLIEDVYDHQLETIEAEAIAMMRAKSDYTVELLDHFYDEDSKTYVFVMPYYRKGNLTDYLDKKWDCSEILCFLFEICQAFLSFNQQGAACWHLDLKPDNILVKSEGEYLICDFGCAKLVDNINNSRFLEISQGRGGGTTLYAAPEIIRNYTGSKYSDIWSLGIMLYQILYRKHPLDKIEPLKKYPEIIKLFVEGKVKIEYKNIPGLESIIEICKSILQPERRMDWEELKKAIYQCVGLPAKTTIIINIEKFIEFAQNVSKIVMGLVYYLNKNEKYIDKFGLVKDSAKVVASCKTFVSLLYKEVENSIENKTKDKNEALIFYIFPQIRKNYTMQEKQRITHLKAVAQRFCSKEFSENEHVNFANIKMNFECDIEEFLIQIRQKNLDKSLFHPIYEWEKIEKICSFILTKSQQKYPGLEYTDRDFIEKFANEIVNE